MITEKQLKALCKFAQTDPVWGTWIAATKRAIRDNMTVYESDYDTYIQYMCGTEGTPHMVEIFNIFTKQWW